MFLAIAEIKYVLNFEKNKIFHNITVSYYLHSVSIRDFIYIYIYIYIADEDESYVCMHKCVFILTWVHFC